MRVRILLLSAMLGTAGAILPAGPASACITVYLPVIGSICDPCDKVEDYTSVRCP